MIRINYRAWQADIRPSTMTVILQGMKREVKHAVCSSKLESTGKFM